MLNMAKKIGWMLIGVLFLACGSGPASVSAAPPADQLDAAIRETSDYLNKQLPKGNKLVILNVQSDFPALSEYIIDELIANTVNDRIFSVVDRRQLDTIRAELDFQYSGEVDDDTMQALGRMAGAQVIISGAVSKIGDLYRLRVRALSVQTAQITGQFNRNIPDGPTVQALAKSQATGYGGGSAATRAQPGAVSASTPTATSPVTTSQPAPAITSAPVPASPPAKTYNIGDKGPAGGLIFYDKGYVSDGWQYLEAASRDCPTAHWGSRGAADVTKTREGIGTGKQNTQLIMQADETGTAARRCREYRQGGYDDWFLPSKDELDLMYQNLKQKGVGEFSNAQYWSSSVESSGWGDGAWNQNFRNGGTENGSYIMGYRDKTFAVRAARAF